MSKQKPKRIEQFSKANHKNAGSPTDIYLFTVDSGWTDSRIQKRFRKYESKTVPTGYTSFYMKTINPNCMVILDRINIVEPDVNRLIMQEKLIEAVAKRRPLEILLYQPVILGAAWLIGEETTRSVSHQEFIKFLTDEFIKQINKEQPNRIYLEHDRKYQIEESESAIAIEFKDGSTLDWGTLASACLNAVRLISDPLTAEEWSNQDLTEIGDPEQYTYLNSINDHFAFAVQQPVDNVTRHMRDILRQKMPFLNL